MIQSIDEIDIAEKRVFIRADLDVPLSPKGEVEDDSKIRRALKTIRYALDQKAKVIVAGNLGRAKGKLDRKYSLEPVGGVMSQVLDCRIYFTENSVGDAVKKVTSDMYPGELVLLENLDFHKQELSGGIEYAKRLSENFDIYVNDAFLLSSSCRASIIELPGLSESAAIGLNFKHELSGLLRLRSPERPFLLILGGLKADRKIEFMESMIDRVDGIVTGGAVANTFLKAQGIGIGLSEVDKNCLYRAKKLLSGAAIREIGFYLPQDVVAAEGNLRNHGSSFIISRETVPDSSKIMDIGAQTVKEYIKQIGLSKTVLWNGPLGVCEKPEFIKGTVEVVNALFSSGSFTSALGRHTLVELSKMGINEKEADDGEGLDFISHGERTALEFIETGTLPAIEALRQGIK